MMLYGDFILAKRKFFFSYYSVHISKWAKILKEKATNQLEYYTPRDKIKPA